MDDLHDLRATVERHDVAIDAIKETQAQHERMLFGWIDDDGVHHPGVYQQATEAAAAIREFFVTLRTTGLRVSLVLLGLAGSATAAVVTFVLHHLAALSRIVVGP